MADLGSRARANILNMFFGLGTLARASPISMFKTSDILSEVFGFKFFVCLGLPKTPKVVLVTDGSTGRA